MTKKNELKNYCFAIYRQINTVEHILVLTKPIYFKNLGPCPLVELINNSFSYLITSHLSRIIEKKSRNSGSIFNIRDFIQSNIAEISEFNNKYKKDLENAYRRIDKIKDEYKNIIEDFENCKDTSFSHIDKKLAKSGKFGILTYNPETTLKLIREIRAILRLAMEKEINEFYEVNLDLKEDFYKLLDTFQIRYDK